MVQHIVRGASQVFYARVLDSDNELLDPTSISVYLLPPSSAYPGDGQQDVKRQAKGIYSTIVTIPSGAELGTWNLLWSITIGSENYSENEEFTVQSSADLFFDSDVLMVNQEYTINIDGSIRDSLGNELGNDINLFFFTEFEPMYCSVQDIRLEIGQYINDVPDFTIALKIWKASMYADNITYIPVPKTGKRHSYYVFAREQFVKASAVLDLLNIVIFNTSGGFKKILGDLEITKFGAKLSDNPLFADWATNRKGWQWVIENGGEMTPRSGHKPGVAVKAGSHPNRPNIGRGWIVSDNGANSRTEAEATLGGSKTRAKAVKEKYITWLSTNG
jgi:hypothetical protein